MLTRNMIVDDLVGELAAQRRGARRALARQRAYVALARAILELPPVIDVDTRSVPQAGGLTRPVWRGLTRAA
jgi:hypothetical protein